MRIHLKGGVWKNTEDEILKAAVMKYGKNQWARISSLLVRKTPKQCKARWYEWLDPSIKKTEWSKEEDEKLLHLAKLMPTQWRTIAPIVGRAPAQCLERYQQLLDEAEAHAAGEDDGLGLQGEVGAESHATGTTNDARRLRPGEIDPHPEAKPARPDPVDMDEDEKDMLSEARARLANTQGKKAKRKARERQLEEARRLATLQKRRELKAAGVDIKTKKKKDKSHIDYNVEIPYEKKPMPGFYDTTDELARKGEGARGLKGKFLDKLEGKGRVEREEDARREAKRKRESKEKDKSRVAFVRASDQEAVRAREEADQAAKRSKLVLPAPQVNDSELATIAKMGQQGTLARELVSLDSGGPVDALLGTYSDTPSVASARTPKVAAQSDRIMNEALAQRARAAQSTPLLGSESTVRSAQVGQGTGFNSALPQGGDMATPNPLAIAAATGRTVPGMAAVRDELGLNTPALDSGATPRERKQVTHTLREQLARKLASLPEPKNEFEIVVPEPSQGDEGSAAAEAVAALQISKSAGGTAATVEDQEDIERRAEAEREQAAERELQRRTQSVKCKLPRPDTLSDAMLACTSDSSISPEVLKLVSTEMRALILHDARKYPVPDVPPLRASMSSDLELDVIPDDMLDAARAMVNKEVGDMLQEMRDAFGRLSGPPGDDLWRDTERSSVWLPQSQKYTDADKVSERDWIEKHRHELIKRRERMTKDAARATKIERKLGVTLGGYQARSKTLGEKLQTAYKEFEQAKLDVNAFRSLYTAEQATIPARIERAEAELRSVEMHESQLQQEYQALLDRHNQTNSSLAAS
ncbi:Pre-mRNA-splicing factor cef1 [Coemansia erecta]|nr:Pre-mRNA-splicing factor cef1 [Coemansia sp. RSA 2618]KAJ2827450.1 Pre-mRNA-splicing factor cef1 [Coemansia erecta]